MSQRKNLIDFIFGFSILMFSNGKAQDVRPVCDYQYLNNASLGEHYMKTYMGDSIQYSSYDFVFFYFNNQPWKQTRKVLLLVMGDTLTKISNDQSVKYLIDKKISISNFNNLPINTDVLWQYKTINSFIFEADSLPKSYMSFYFWSKKRNTSYDILVAQDKIVSLLSYTSCIKEKVCKEEIEDFYNKFNQLNNQPLGQNAGAVGR